jgi:hypothetical protein
MKLVGGGLDVGRPGSHRVACEHLALDATDPVRVLVGGEPFPEPILTWWNFVAPTHKERASAARQTPRSAGAAPLPAPRASTPDGVPWAAAPRPQPASVGRSPELTVVTHRHAELT